MNEEIKKRIVEILYPQNPPPIFAEEYVITQEIINFIQQFPVNKLQIKGLFLPAKDRKKRQQNVEIKCSVCGKTELKILMAGQVENILMKKQDFLCEKCEKKLNEKKEIEEKIKKKKEENNILQNTRNYINTMLNAKKSWKDGVSVYDKLKNIGYRCWCGINWDDVEKYICNMDYYDFLNTPYWKAISEYVKVKNHYKCEMCGKTGVLHVHHPTYDFHGRELQNINKLKCLCDSCHKIFHNKDNQRG